MSRNAPSFLDKVLGRIGRLDQEGIQTVVKRLARERDLLETLFNTIEDGVLVVDETGRILYLNRAVTRLLGLKSDTAEGQSIQRFLPEIDWAKLASWDRRGGDQVARHEFEVNIPRPRLLSMYVAPLDGRAEGGSGLALIIHDATEARQQTEAAIESERLQALTLLAASVAHEIGNPLNALHLHVQLMERELRRLRAALSEGASAPAAEHTDKIEQYLGVARGEITRLDYIVTQFLQAIRPSPPQFQVMQANDVVRATIELLRPEIENRGITVKEKLGRRLPLVRLDPNQIKQALVNLVKNAMQAMAKGGVLTLQSEARADAICLSVADNGRGIPSEDISRIFEPFFTTKKKGSGLGLMIVQRIVRDHGGRIELESRGGQGTTFRLWFPVLEPPQRLLQARHD